MKPIEITNVTRRFDSFVAVDDVDLTVDSGEVVALVGANGAGKTTLIRMILGLLRPTAGRIRLFGLGHSRELRRRIGYVPQNLGLYRDLTAAENVEFRAEVFGVDRPGSLPFADGSLVADLPLGLQRRAAFTAATQHNPDLLVLDEPTSGVSPLARTVLWDLIRERAEAGVAVLVSTHYMDEAEQADRLVLMSRGKVAAAGKLADIIGGQQAVEVISDHWERSFDALDRPGRLITLYGTAVRILGESVDGVRRELADVGVAAEVRSVPATLDETMVMLDS